MTTAYVGATYVANAIGSDEQLAMATGTALTQLILSASSLVDAALSNGGYATPVGGTVPEVVKLATMGALVPLLYARRGTPVPEQYIVHMRVLNDIAKGNIPIPELTPTAQDGVGGVVFTESSSSVTGSVVQVYGGLRGVR